MEGITVRQEAAVKGKTRDSNLELFRIIAMFLIVLHHYVVNSGLTNEGGVIFSDPFSWRSLALLFLGVFGKAGTNCFLMITGYFMCTSRITAKKFMKLFGEVVFYNVIIYIIFLVAGYEQLTPNSVLVAVFPFSIISINFIGCYLAFFLFIPFLNKLVQALSEKQHIYLLLLCGFVYIALGTAHRITFNYLGWFIVLYLIASYLRLYPKKFYDSTRLWAALTALSAVLLCAGVVFGLWIYQRTGENLYYFFAIDSNSFLPVMFGVSSFMLFRNLKIPQSRVINTIAASSFGVLCIHANSGAMRMWLWRDTLDNVGHYSPLHAVLCALGVYAACTLIDMARIRLVEVPFFRLWDRKFPPIAEKFKAWEAKRFGKLNIK